MFHVSFDVTISLNCITGIHGKKIIMLTSFAITTVVQDHIKHLLAGKRINPKGTVNFCPN
jgi:hypothetical protein